MIAQTIEEMAALSSSGEVAVQSLYGNLTLRGLGNFSEGDGRIATRTDEPFEPRDEVRRLLSQLLTKGLVELTGAYVSAPLPWGRRRRGAGGDKLSESYFLTCGACERYPHSKIKVLTPRLVEGLYKTTLTTQQPL